MMVSAPVLTNPTQVIGKNGKVRWKISFHFMHDGEYVRLRKNGFLTPEEATIWLRKQYFGIVDGHEKPPEKQARSGRPRKSEGYTFAQVVELVKPIWKKTLKESTVKLYEYQLGKYLIPLFGEKLFDLMTQADLNRLNEATKEQKNDTNTFILRGIITQADNLKIKCPKIDFSGMKSKKGESKKVFLSMEEISQFLQQISKETKPFYIFLLGTGMRISEAFAIDWIDVSVKEKTILIDKQFSSMAKKITTTKSGKERTIPLSDMALQALKMQANLSGSEWLIKGPVFGNIKRWMIDKELKTVKSKKHITPHVLRHTFASILVQSGTSLETISALLGHADLQTTQIYTHFDTSKLKSAMQNLAKFEA